MILARAYQILAPIAVADALRSALQALDPGQSGMYTMTTGLGPEAAPGAGVSSTITHYIDGPRTAESLYQGAVAIVAQHPGAEITDQEIQILDAGVLRWCVPQGAIDYQVDRSLYQYDETWEPT